MAFQMMCSNPKSILGLFLAIVSPWSFSENRKLWPIPSIIILGHQLGMNININLCSNIKIATTSKFQAITELVNAHCTVVE